MEVISKVRTVNDIPQVVNEILKPYGLYVEFKSFPNSWYDSAYSSPHPTPLYKNEDKIYQGWKGQWKGSVKRLDGKITTLLVFTTCILFLEMVRVFLHSLF